MQELIRIYAIRGRAEAISLSFPKLCREAGHVPSTIYRWLSGEIDPKLGSYTATCEDLERVLAAYEARTLEHLQRIQGGGAKDRAA